MNNNPGVGRRSGSSRRGKKSGGGAEKPRQPQRGLGVAQLEKIRLHGQLAAAGCLSHIDCCNFKDGDVRMEMAFSPPRTSYHCGLPPSFMMGVGGDGKGREIRYSESQYPCSSSGTNYMIEGAEPHYYEPPTPSMVTLPLLRQRQSDQDWVQKRRRRYEWYEPIGPSGLSLDSRDWTHELDLDLKLSL